MPHIDEAVMSDLVRLGTKVGQQEKEIASLRVALEEIAGAALVKGIWQLDPGLMVETMGNRARAALEESDA